MKPEADDSIARETLDLSGEVAEAAGGAADRAGEVAAGLATDANQTVKEAAAAAGDAALDAAAAKAGEVSAQAADVPVAGPVASDVTGWLEHFAAAEHWPGQADLIDLTSTMHAGTAALLLGAGVVYLLFGASIFRYLVLLNAAIVGGIIGLVVGSHLDQPVGGAVIGAVALGAAAWPTLKHAVAVLGAGLGFVVGLCVWNGLGLAENYCVAGGLIGGVFLGMLSYSLFKTSVMLFMAMQGAVMLIAGLLGMLFQYQSVGESVRSTLETQQIILPIALMLPVLLGVVWQTAPAAKKE